MSALEALGIVYAFRSNTSARAANSSPCWYFLRLLHRIFAALRAAAVRAGDPLPASPPSLPSATACLFFLPMLNATHKRFRLQSLFIGRKTKIQSAKHPASIQPQLVGAHRR